MSVANSSSYCVRVVFLVLEDDFFLNSEFFFLISAINHEKVKKQIN